MCHENLAKTRESYLSAFCDGLKNMILATESFVDNCHAISTKLDITIEYHHLFYESLIIRLFSSNLHLNNKGEEPRLYMSNRVKVWRRVMSWIDESTRSNYYLLNLLNAMDYNYSNLSDRIGNICIHVLAVSNFRSCWVGGSENKVLLNARMMAKLISVFWG